MDTRDEIHQLYRAAIAADEHYSAVLNEHAATRFESREIRMARCGRTQYLIREALDAKVKADAAYNRAVINARSVVGEL
jgi:hypothetical protein